MAGDNKCFGFLGIVGIASLVGKCAITRITTVSLLIYGAPSVLMIIEDGHSLYPQGAHVWTAMQGESDGTFARTATTEKRHGRQRREEEVTSTAAARFASPTFLTWSESANPGRHIDMKRTESCTDGFPAGGFLWLLVQSRHSSATSCLNMQQQILLVNLNVACKLFTR